MSMQVYAALPTNRIPATGDVQSALDRQGTGLVLDPANEVATHNGYWPVTLEGAATGFEMYRLDATDLASFAGPGQPAAGAVVAFRWSGDLVELRAAYLTAAAVAEAAGGHVVDSEDTVLTVAEAIEEADV